MGSERADVTLLESARTSHGAGTLDQSGFFPSEQGVGRYTQKFGGSCWRKNVGIKRFIFFYNRSRRKLFKIRFAKQHDTVLVDNRLDFLQFHPTAQGAF